MRSKSAPASVPTPALDPELAGIGGTTTCEHCPNCGAPVFVWLCGSGNRIAHQVRCSDATCDMRGPVSLTRDAALQRWTGIWT